MWEVVWIGNNTDELVRLEIHVAIIAVVVDVGWVMLALCIRRRCTVLVRDWELGLHSKKLGFGFVYLFFFAFKK